MREKKKWNKIIRVLIQVSFFFFNASAWATSFAGIRYIGVQISTSEPIVFNDFLKMLVILTTFTFIFGRFFCGYACSFGAFGDAMYGLSCIVQKKYLKRHKVFKVPNKIVKYLIKVKYIVLLTIFLLCALGHYNKIANADPWEIFSMIINAQLNVEGKEVAVAFLIIIMIGMLTIERFFCIALCPMGAIFSLTPNLPWFILRRHRSQCIKKCSICHDNCPARLEVDLHSDKIGECVQCNRCVDSCPKENIYIGIGNLHGIEAPIILFKATFLAILFLYFF